MSQLWILFLRLFSKIRFTASKKNIFKLSSGTIIGQGISIIIIPILTRIYGPAAFGDLAIIQSTSVIINSFSDLGLTNAIMISNEGDMERIYKITFFSVISVSILFSLLYLLFYPIIKLVDVGAGYNIIFIALYTVGAIISSQQIQVSYAWLNRKSAYSLLLWNPIISNLNYAIFAIIFGLLGYKTYGLFIGWGIGQFATLLHMKRHIPRMKKGMSLSIFKGIITEYRHFVVYQMPTNIIIAIKTQLPILLIKGLFGSTMAGYYSMTMRILQMPISLVAGAIGRVFYSTISNMVREGKEIGQFVYNNINKVMKIAIVPTFFAISIGDIIVNVFLGSNWAPAGIFIRILGIQNLFLFLVTTCCGLSVVLQKQRVALILNLFQAVGFIAAFALAKYAFESIIVALLLSEVVYIILNVTYFSIMFNHMKVSYKKYIFNIILYFIPTILLAEGLRIILYFLNFVDTV